jgi:hypothetical protein
MEKICFAAELIFPAFLETLFHHNSSHNWTHHRIIHQFLVVLAVLLILKEKVFNYLNNLLGMLSSH